MSSSLPIPRSSPTLTADSSTTASSLLDSASTNTSHISSSSIIPPTATRPFGAGWKSSDTLHAEKPSDFEPDRTRSPSLPILPSVKPTQPLSYQQDLPDYSLYTSAPSTAFPKPAWGFDTLSHKASLGSIDIELGGGSPGGHSPTHRNAFRPPSALIQQKSTPKLGRPGLSSRRSVRFEVDEDVSSDGSASGRALSASLPVLPSVGEGRNVFIHRVSHTLTEDELRHIATAFGEVVSVKVQQTRAAKPHAFVMFKKPERAAKFMSHLRSRAVDCEYGKEDHQVQTKALEDPLSANLYIAGLPPSLTYDALEDLLLPGKICSWKPLMDEGGNRRGPVMARMQTRVQAEAVIKRLTGKYYPGMSERLQVRIADSEEQKHFKRYQMRERVTSVPSASAAESGPMRRRASMPAEAMRRDLTDLSLFLQQQSLLASQLNAINEKLASSHLSPTHSNYPHAHPLRQVPSFAPSPVPGPLMEEEDGECPVLSPTISTYPRRGSSNASVLSSASYNANLSDQIWGASTPTRTLAEAWSIDPFAFPSSSPPFPHTHYSPLPILPLPAPRPRLGSMLKRDSDSQVPICYDASNAGGGKVQMESGVGGVGMWRKGSVGDIGLGLDVGQESKMSE
ncbi:hypothetical protein L202_03613 [Cryptococcus amylolentus CBS 6039]|uniref:RRM domain-containing protein n=2 Tax=Cryptococcus amylolentus TaxID=104669 RepID=A0A1E3HTK4_9TREE|nr:hypothetical protein L202_03613 [Cryptococcus amylolentus CBS 6039]ODN79683.1 hypothetical protein L202_03613 [Cryptococcus amylolentus CBS 6039]ODO07988.1 hypothetical protein I350_03571 [Cryptococcus amylolentus CBS 6273]